MPGPLDTESMRREYEYARCTTSYMTAVWFHGSDRAFYVERNTKNAWVALNSILRKWDYRFRDLDGGTYNCRRTSSGRWSLHSYGLALDINPDKNPVGTSTTNMALSMIRAIEEIRTRRTGRQVFAWGGRWSGSASDPMHFQVGATRAELAEGLIVGGATAPAPAPAPIPQPKPTPPTGGTDMSQLLNLRFNGNKSELGHYLQRCILRIKPGSITADGMPGAKTAAVYGAITNVSTSTLKDRGIGSTDLERFHVYYIRAAARR